MSRAGVALIVVAFVALQATNNAVVSVMGLFVTETLGLDVVWAGVALGVAAGLEVPALLLIGPFSRRFSSFALLTSGASSGSRTTPHGDRLRAGALVALQALNAWFFAVIAGVGLTLFQAMIARPGLASGLYTNTRRVGAIVSGPIIGLGSLPALGYGGASPPAPC